MAEQSKVVVATHNKHKLVELEAALAQLQYELVPMSDWKLKPAAETGTTFVENALIKARQACRLTSLPAIADDSGLVVDLLGGKPGVLSSRYAGDHASDEDNNALLLQQIKAKRKQDDTVRACFVTILAYLEHEHNPKPIIVEGFWHGTIVDDPRGAHGFGYDPLFLPLGFHQTVAELDPLVKCQESHRALAAQKLVRVLLDQIDNHSGASTSPTGPTQTGL